MNQYIRQHSRRPLCAVLIALLGAVAPAATPAGTVMLSLSGGVVPPGGVAGLPLVLESSGAAPDTLVLKLAFDTAALSVCDVVKAPAIGAKLVAYRPTDGGLTVVFFGGEGAMAHGPVATVVLEAAAGAATGSVSVADGDSTASDSEASAQVVSLAAGTVQIAPLEDPHDADTDGNGRIGLTELLRVIQLYNAGGIACDATSEDGFTPGEGGRDCTPHDLDYAGQDWRIGLSELLRAIQFFNAYKGVYRVDAGGEDGFAPGLGRGYTLALTGKP